MFTVNNHHRITRHYLALHLCFRLLKMQFQFRRSEVNSLHKRQKQVAEKWTSFHNRYEWNVRHVTLCSRSYMSMRCHGLSSSFLPPEIDSSQKVAKSSANGPDDSESEENSKLHLASSSSLLFFFHWIYRQRSKQWRQRSTNKTELNT